jgi:exodeoxyribonuclease III
MKKLSIVSYNLNGIRSALGKGFGQWLEETNADVVCVQELKAMQEQVDTSLFTHLGYHQYWHSAEKKGYSGVAIFSKIKPNHVEVGCGIEKYDVEGRVIRADFDSFSIVNTYFPSGSSGDERHGVKMNFLKDYIPFINGIKKQQPNLLVAGDYNICHKAIDIHDPISNKDSSGFKPEEREWMTHFFEQGFVDTFRKFNQHPDEYSWWSFRAAARERNKGWRIDYINASTAMEKNLTHAAILQSVKHSDHCPVLLQIEI